MSDQDPQSEAEHLEPEASQLETRTLYRHWMAALGGALMLAGFLAFVILLIVDLTSGIDNPYRSIIGFIAAPIIGIIGLLLFLISIRVQVLEAIGDGPDCRCGPPADLRVCQRPHEGVNVSRDLFELAAQCVNLWCESVWARRSHESLGLYQVGDGRLAQDVSAPGWL